MASQTPHNSSTSTALIDSDDRRAAYQMAVQLLMYESTLAWSRFNVLLVANSIIIPGIGLFSLNGQPLLVMLLSALGAIVCISLGIIINRGLDFHAYWEAAASELEVGAAPALQVIDRSVRFRRGESLMFTVADRTSQLRLGWRRVRARNVTNVLNLLFILIYLVLFIEGLTNVTGWVVK